MTWEEFEKQPNKYWQEMYEKTDIECPKCGQNLIKDKTVVLTSLPPKYRYFCESCGWLKLIRRLITSTERRHSDDSRKIHCRR